MYITILPSALPPYTLPWWVERTEGMEGAAGWATRIVASSVIKSQTCALSPAERNLAEKKRIMAETSATLRPTCWDTRVSSSDLVAVGAIATL